MSCRKRKKIGDVERRLWVEYHGDLRAAWEESNESIDDYVIAHRDAIDKVITPARRRRPWEAPPPNHQDIVRVYGPGMAARRVNKALRTMARNENPAHSGYRGPITEYARIAYERSLHQFGRATGAHR